jgi:RNA polymerase sigma factor for flagellar operon FliA
VTKRVTRSASAALWEQYRITGDPETRAELLSQYIGLVHHTVRGIAARVGDAVEFEDLVGAGSLGLVRAFEGFDPSRGTAFTTYATQRIRGAVLDELRAADWRPRSAREQARSIQQASAAITQETGRPAAPAEVATALGIDLDTYWRWQAQGSSTTIVRMQEPDANTERGVTTLADRIADPNAAAPDAALERDETCAQLREQIALLPEQQRVVLALCYDEELSLRQIAQVLHVTESRVSQVRTAAIKNLRERLVLESV